MDGAAGLVALQAGQAEAFGHDALACEGGIAVQEDGQHLAALGVVFLVLLGAGLAENDGIDRFEVGGVGREREVNDIAVELTVGRGAEVVFHIA